MHRAAHERRGAVDARDDLRDDREPRVHRDGLDALAHRRVDLGALAVLEPEREQAQDVLVGVGVRVRVRVGVRARVRVRVRVRLGLGLEREG